MNYCSMEKIYMKLVVTLKKNIGKTEKVSFM